MKLYSKHVIDNNIVELVNVFSDITVFQHNCEDENGYVTLYFVQVDDVIQEIKIYADCGHNIGYVSEIKFKSKRK